MLKAYQLINEYSSWTPRTSLPEVSGVALSQQGNTKAAQITAEWKKKEFCHNCGKKVHIKPDCTEPIIDNDDTNEKDDKIVENKSGKKKNLLKKKSIQFSNKNESTYVESGNESVCASQYSFAFNTHAQPTNDLCRMILLDNQSTCDIFCNSKILSNIHKTPKTMQVIGNSGSITSNRQGHLKITVTFGLMNEPSPTSCA